MPISIKQLTLNTKVSKESNKSEEKPQPTASAGLSKLDKEVIINDKNLKQKVEKVYSILDETKLREVDIKTIEIVLTAQELIEELNEDGD